MDIFLVRIINTLDHLPAMIAFASHDSKEDSFSDRNVYPIGCIKSLEKINI
jgi:hypothetical protein